MRISDWSSDVCSSDLSTSAARLSGISSMEITSSVTANANAASTKASSRVTWRPRCTKPSAIRGACASPVAFMAPPFPPRSPGAAAAAARMQDMFTTDSLSGSKPEQYAQLAQQARALVAGDRDRIANAANLSALVYHALPRLNWVGFYFFDGNELVVGPFQGQPACIRIPLDKGVCGAAARSGDRKSVVL